MCGSCLQSPRGSWNQCGPTGLQSWVLSWLALRSGPESSVGLLRARPWTGSLRAAVGPLVSVIDLRNTWLKEPVSCSWCCPIISTMMRFYYPSLLVDSSVLDTNDCRFRVSPGLVLACCCMGHGIPGQVSAHQRTEPGPGTCACLLMSKPGSITWVWDPRASAGPLVDGAGSWLPPEVVVARRH